ncbi:transmembrane protein, putative (macronuclear) [Tetrahymena thermophila SB210]|uniref:Transmembrane protein, putative n=1 Tax=Tetrahymena thermophila (strain SB210) TaxID=312017 RepID=I7M8C2_TETTS|nr:transmembrane protein, putative [Tetrahymena thermophila SB210]EAR97602.1 transmembrane protein, putative [Tetrahymena thermophila SB210]|eukprot:XP_001017847.1 transmembrane protein, putative [Tetrahymena thermophila SB210]
MNTNSAKQSEQKQNLLQIFTIINIAIISLCMYSSFFTLLFPPAENYQNTQILGVLLLIELLLGVSSWVMIRKGIQSQKIMITCFSQMMTSLLFGTLLLYIYIDSNFNFLNKYKIVSLEENCCYFFSRLFIAALTFSQSYSIFYSQNQLYPLQHNLILIQSQNSLDRQSNFY